MAFEASASVLTETGGGRGAPGPPAPFGGGGAGGPAPGFFPGNGGGGGPPPFAGGGGGGGAVEEAFEGGGGGGAVMEALLGGGGGGGAVAEAIGGGGGAAAAAKGIGGGGGTAEGFGVGGGGGGVVGGDDAVGGSSSVTDGLEEVGGSRGTGTTLPGGLKGTPADTLSLGIAGEDTLSFGSPKEDTLSLGSPKEDALSLPFLLLETLEDCAADLMLAAFVSPSLVDSNDKSPSKETFFSLQPESSSEPVEEYSVMLKLRSGFSSLLSTPEPPSRTLRQQTNRIVARDNVLNAVTTQEMMIAFI